MQEGWQAPPEQNSPSGQPPQSLPQRSVPHSRVEPHSDRQPSSHGRLRHSIETSPSPATVPLEFRKTAGTGAPGAYSLRRIARHGRCGEPGEN